MSTGKTNKTGETVYQLIAIRDGEKVVIAEATRPLELIREMLLRKSSRLFEEYTIVVKGET